ncbi:MAG TPA: prephenate dehydratase domain-containing protein, partial [Rectinemataceae bacterium]|nr:prephenate dehydratase domain-containing protein [Rectinemataceae bacterium]
MTLKDLREDIDRIDARLLALLNERLEKALMTKSFKDRVVDEGRELQVLERARRSARCLAGPEFSVELFRSIMAESRAVQTRGLETIGFQGEHGAYSEMAAKAWSGKAAAMPCREFVDVFDAVQEGRLDYGIVPVENTLGGLVGPVNSILVYSDLAIVAAVDMPVSHCLLSLPGADHREIRAAYSHTQALAQCRRFLARNRLEARPWFDTAGAARMLAEERPAGVAVVASRFAAELYGLEIIKDGIQDSEDNRTRFFVLARRSPAEPEAAPPTGAGASALKCSAVFFTEDKAGSLFGTLEIFARAGINLTRIESVPNRPGDYAIFIDFEGSEREPR